MNEAANSTKHLVMSACLVALATAGTPGCSKKAPQVAAPVAAAAPSAAPNGATPAVAVEHGKRKQRAIDPPVYVDGTPVAIMRFAELPPGMTQYAKTAGSEKIFFRLADYVAALGVSLDKVKAIHVGGKQRMWTRVTGDELRANTSELLFHFTKGNGGKPSSDWDTSKLSHSVRVDYFTSLAIFTSKDEPALDLVRSCYLQQDGECSDKVPYVEADMAKGTRIYVDGRLSNIVKRRLVKDDSILEGKGTPSPHYSLARYLDSVGVDTKTAKAVEFIADDDRFVGRASQSQWKSNEPAVFFTLPPHAHGKVMANLPASLLAKDSTPETQVGTVEAILVYRNIAPPKARYLVTFDESSVKDENGNVTIGSGTGYGETAED